MATTEVKKTSIITPLIKPEIHVNRKDIGALWGKVGENGDEYFTGEIVMNGVKTQVNVRRNQYKENERHPDWRIYPYVSPKQDASQSQPKNDDQML